MLKITATSLCSPENQKDYFDDTIYDRRWELSINWKLKVYLTDEEKDFFLDKLKEGKKFIRVGDMILTRHFDCLLPIRQKRKVTLTEEEKDNIVKKEKERMETLKANYDPTN